MEEEKKGQESMEAGPVADSAPAAEVRRGPTWRAWAISVLAAILLSVAATLLLGGSGAFRSENGGPGAAGNVHGQGDACCPPRSR